MKLPSLVLICSLAAVPFSTAQTFNIVSSFDGTDGAQPLAPVVQGNDGNFYGAANSGGPYGAGTVFKVKSDGTLSVLHNFCERQGCPDGREAGAALIQAADGSYYGTTTFGGVSDNYGTVFRISRTGKFKTIYRFCATSSCTDGAYLYSPLIQATDGNFYGTTNEGGDLTCFAPYGCGTVFKLTSAGVLTTLHSFHVGEGSMPSSGLVQARDGNFYGTTTYGGTYGYGTVYKITASGILTAIYNFCVQSLCADGSVPYAGLLEASDGNFYGTTLLGGSAGFGTIFRITPQGALTILHSFLITDGSAPYGVLVEASDGNFYGTTASGGNTNSGTAFEITPEGIFTSLISFGTSTNGSYPGGLIQDTSGTFYGTMQTGGSSNDGAVFSLSLGLPPFVEPRPTSGKTGSKIMILGTDLTGTSAVSFNGASASFTLVSSSEIIATVPSGATTGKIQVVTPNGTLASNVAFLVRH
jgi:uncharacterized repeat protein (TIGR03803 family)